MRHNEDSFTEKQFQNRIDLGKKILPEYYNTYVNSWNKVVVTEYPLRNIRLGDVPITGVFDKIEFEGNNVNVVDYKTGSVKRGLEKMKIPDETNPLGGDYWRQIMFYKILIDAQQYKPWKMVSGEIDFIEKDERKNNFLKYRFEMVPEQIDIVKSQIREVYARMMNLEFTKGCGKEDCEWCNFVRENYGK
jgi:DNA helicase-2/ATP-dependent DNA helicase PcrA